MSNIAQQAHRAANLQLALSTMGHGAAWDAAVINYLATEALVHSDAEFGALAAATEARVSEQIDSAALRRAETAHTELCEPFWAAARALAATPAPTFAAAMFKAHAIDVAEVWNDNDGATDYMALVQAELARFTGDA